MAALSVLTPDIRVEIPEIPSFVAERASLRALRMLCEESRVWRTSINLTTVANQATYTLTSLLPTGTELVDVISMKPAEGGSPVQPKTFAWLDTNLNGWRDETSDAATWYVLDSNNTIRLVYKPSAAVTNQYYLRLAVKPTLSATTINDVVLNKYDELIKHGALGILFKVPRRPWTDMQLAGYHDGIFQQGLPSARAEATDEFQTGVARKVKYGGL